MTVVLEVGTVAMELQAEHPGLGLLSTTVHARAGRSSLDSKRRLRMLSDRHRGAQAMVLRTRPVPFAYRVFYRHVGVDPDADHTPVEAAMLERLLRGGFRARDLVEDALTIALVETGVPIWALDDDLLDGALELRLARAGERLGRAPEAAAVSEGQIVVCDRGGPLQVLFGPLPDAQRVTRGTLRIRLFTVAVAGVSSLEVQEAFWTCTNLLDQEPPGATVGA